MCDFFFLFFLHTLLHSVHRCQATTVRDMYTRELTMLMRDEIFNIYGEYPHVVVCELRRTKLDANRAIDEAAFGIPSMEAAWETVRIHF